MLSGEQLYRGAFCGKTAEVKALLDAGAEVNWVVPDDEEDRLKKSLGADNKLSGTTPLYVAARQVRVLVD